MRRDVKFAMMTAATPQAAWQMHAASNHRVRESASSYALALGIHSFVSVDSV
jgi:hypothetical protein